MASMRWTRSEHRNCRSVIACPTAGARASKQKQNAAWVKALIDGPSRDSPRYGDEWKVHALCAQPSSASLQSGGSAERLFCPLM
jgi:hypothetical protein